MSETDETKAMRTDKPDSAVSNRQTEGQNGATFSLLDGATSYVPIILPRTGEAEADGHNFTSKVHSFPWRGDGYVAVAVNETKITGGKVIWMSKG